MGHFDMICPSFLYVSPPSSSKHACTCPHSHMHTHTQTYTQIYERPSSTQWFVCRSEQAGTPGSLTHTEWHFVLFLNLLYNQDCLFTRRVCVCCCLFVCLRNDGALMQSLIYSHYLFSYFSAATVICFLSSWCACLSLRCRQVWVGDTPLAQTQESSVLCCVVW